MTTIKIDNQIICQIGCHTLRFITKERYQEFLKRLEYPLINKKINNIEAR